MCYVLCSIYMNVLCSIYMNVLCVWMFYVLCVWMFLLVPVETVCNCLSTLATTPRHKSSMCVLCVPPWWPSQYVHAILSRDSSWGKSERMIVCWNGFLCPVEPESSSRVTGSHQHILFSFSLLSLLLSSTPRLKVLAVEPLSLPLIHSLRLIYECNEWLKKANKKKITRRRKGEEWGASGSSDTRISSFYQHSSLSSSLAHPNTVFV